MKLFMFVRKWLLEENLELVHEKKHLNVRFMTTAAATIVNKVTLNQFMRRKKHSNVTFVNK